MGVVVVILVAAIGGVVILAAEKSGVVIYKYTLGSALTMFAFGHIFLYSEQLLF